MKIAVKNIKVFKQKALEWATNQSKVICYLDSNAHSYDQYGAYECILAVGVEQEIRIEREGTAFDDLMKFVAQKKQWLFGCLSYDLKNEIEDLESNHEDRLQFPMVYFFAPTYLLLLKKNGELEIISQKEKPTFIWDSIKNIELKYQKQKPINKPILSRITKQQYLNTFGKIKQHIVDGDLYEMNFCQEFFVETAIEPLPLFHKLNGLSQAPFAAYLAIDDLHLLCGSPERFVCKRGNKVISQPIKGTIARGKTKEEDEGLKKELYHSEKDRAENVMIVDLVRNDLTKTSQTGSIKVEELFGIYSFEKVHQMISTITAQKKEEIPEIEVIRQAFPMGSMTGAPKVMSMQLIEQYEKSKRGLYSGAVGYISPEGDFDFNVVIRSLLYNASAEYLAFQVGGAIVYDSDPKAEYEECLLKAQSMLEALTK